MLFYICQMFLYENEVENDNVVDVDNFENEMDFIQLLEFRNDMVYYEGFNEIFSYNLFFDI